MGEENTNLNNRNYAIGTSLELALDAYNLSGCVRTKYLNLALAIGEFMLNEFPDVTRHVTVVNDARGNSLLNEPTWVVYWEEV